MIINFYDNVYSPVQPDKVFDITWNDVVRALMTLQPCKTKSETPLFNVWSFKDQDYVTAPKGGVSRCSANALGSWGLVLDYDGQKNDDGEVIENTAIGEAQAELQDYEYVLYTTFRHLQDGVLNKFRVVLPFQEALPTEQFKAKREGFIERFPVVDPASFNASQAFYLHSAWDPAYARTVYHPGSFLDPHSIPDTVPKAVPQKYQRSKEPSQNPTMTWQPPPSNVYTAKVLGHLGQISGMHYADAMRLANAVKGSGGEFWDYHSLCDRVFASDSSHREKSNRFLQDEFNRAYDRVTKETVNKLLQDYGVKPLPILCLP